MIIRNKITLMHFLIAIGFLASMVFIVLRLNGIRDLKTLELQSANSLTELRALELKTILFSKRHQTLDLLLEDWVISVRRFNYLYTQMLNNPAHKLLGEYEIALKNAMILEWDSFINTELSPLIEDLESAFDISGEIRGLVGRTTISISRELIGEEFGLDYPLYLELARIESYFARQRGLLLGDIFESAEHFIGELRLRISEYLSTLLYITIAIALAFQTAGSFLALRFSRNLRRHVTQMGDTLTKVGNGVFDIKLDIRSGDEFEIIANNFNLLTQELWTRIESMKDMMREIGNAVESVNATEEIEELMLQLAIKNTHADAGILMDVSDEGLYPRHTGDIPSLAPTDSEILNPLTTPGKPLLIRRNEEDPLSPPARLRAGEPLLIRKNEGELPENADPNSKMYISSAIFIPIIPAKEARSVLVLVHAKEGNYFNDLDYAYMRSYGEFISLTLDNMDRYNQLITTRKTKHEINVAAGIQKSLLPERMPAMQGIKIAAFSDAAKGIGGDFYDVFDIGEDKTAIIICDVAGKGVSASLIMVMIRTIIRSISSPEKRADRIMIELNRAIAGSVGFGKYATSAIIILDPKSGIVSYSNAAHIPLYIFRGDISKYHRFDTDGLPLGVEGKTAFGHRKIKINKDDYLVLFTDGLSEARNNKGAELGDQALLKFVARNAGSDPNELVKLVKNFVREYSGGYEHDDQTFLALRVT